MIFFLFPRQLCLFAHDYFDMRIGEIDAVGGQFVVDALVCVVEHTPIVCAFGPCSDGEVDAAVVEFAEEHYGSEAFGLDYALIAVENVENGLARFLHIVAIRDADGPIDASCHFA